MLLFVEVVVVMVMIIMIVVIAMLLFVIDMLVSCGCCVSVVAKVVLFGCLLFLLL